MTELNPIRAAQINFAFAVASARLLCVLAALQIAAAGPVAAQEKGFIGKFLERFSKKEEAVEPVKEGPDFSNSACPEDAQWMGAAQVYPDYCGRDRPPPIHFERHWLDGVWDVYTPGDQPVDQMKIYVHMKGGILHRVDPNAPSPASAVVRYRGNAEYNQGGYAIILNEKEDGSLETAFGQFGYCSCVSVHWRMRRTGDPNILRGEWEFDGRKGASTWRRSASGTGTVRSVVISSAVHDAEGDLVDDRFEYGARRGRIERTHPVSCGYGDMRGNCDKVWVSVIGDRFYGAHDVWLDPASHFELYSAHWICTNLGGQNSAWRYCDGAGEPGAGVAGVQAQLILWPGMKPGPINLWVDGQPIPIDVVLAGYPEEKEERPALVSLKATDADGEAVTRIEEGKPFMLTATYEGEHPDAWTRVAAPNLPSTEAAGKLVEQEVILQRTKDLKTFESAWMTVKRSVVTPVVDEPLGEEGAVRP